MKSTGNIFNPPESVENSLENLRPDPPITKIRPVTALPTYKTSAEKEPVKGDNPTTENALPASTSEVKNPDEIFCNAMSRENNLQQ